MPELVPAMCALDYEFAKAGNYLFLRKQTLATRGQFCDCFYVSKKAATADQVAQAKLDEKAEAKRAETLFNRY